MLEDHDRIDAVIRGGECAVSEVGWHDVPVRGMAGVAPFGTGIGTSCGPKRLSCLVAKPLQFPTREQLRVGRAGFNLDQ